MACWMAIGLPPGLYTRFVHGSFQRFAPPRNVL